MKQLNHTMAPKTIKVDTGNGESIEAVSNDREFKALIDDYQVRFLAVADAHQTKIRGFESLVDGGQYTLSPPQQQNSPVGNSSLMDAFKGLEIEMHRIRETLPSVLVGHVVSPSEASKKPRAVATVFDALGLNLAPRNNGTIYQVPNTCGPEWIFSWQWPRTVTDDRILERQSYEPVCTFLKQICLFGEDVSDGHNCVEGFLFNNDIFSKTKENPHLIRGQAVYHRHRVAGRTDIVVLKEERRGHILRHMVKFAVELKTVEGYEQSKTGCLREAQLQLIGLNAFNTLSSPPVLLSNLARTHQVVYLTKDEEWNYDIVVQNCATFAAAVHFAKLKSDETSISEHFARHQAQLSPSG